MNLDRVFAMKFSKVYPLLVAKAERKSRTKGEVDQVIEWLTGFSTSQVEELMNEDVSMKEFFDKAKINENANLITGVVCGVRVEEIEDPTMQKIRYLDKLVDELAKGKKIEKILRK